jgi:radical SAM protein with 4Fe4S-binding SPASM domain
MGQSNGQGRQYRLRRLRSYLRGDPICPDLPATAVLGVSNRCNLDCPMCLRSVMEFPGHLTSFDQFQSVIDQGVPYLRYISLDGPGEPLLNPDLHRMVRYARSAGIRVVYSTNATLLFRKNVDFILDSGLDHIIFSVNGVTADVFEQYNRGADYEEVVGNIRRFLRQKTRRRSPILVTIQMVRLPGTIPQAKQFQKIWRLPGVDSVRIKEDVVRIKGVCAEEGRKEQVPTNRCPRLWGGPLYVNYDGGFWGCPGILFRKEAFGNARDQSLKELWNGERMQAMRRAHVDGDFAAVPECAGCQYPRPRLPLILGSFLFDPFLVGRLLPVVERLAFFRRLPFYERPGSETGC